VGAPQKALSTELVAGMNMNGGKQMYIRTPYRSDSSMERSCIMLMVSIVRVVSIVRPSPGTPSPDTTRGTNHEVSDFLSHRTD
jgi:hypothetical protein